jgi:hypothetical protein
MAYKKYKIINRIKIQNYIKFELDGDVEFSNGRQNFIFCLSKYPYINYQVGDEIEIDLTKASFMSVNDYQRHQEMVREVSKNMLEDIVMDDLQEDKEEKKEGQLQEQGQINLLVSAYDKKVVHKSFRNTIE